MEITSSPEMSRVENLDYHALNAMLNLVGEDGKIPFEMDKLAVKKYFLDHVNENTVFFHNLKEKLEYLVDNEYYEAEVLDQYSFSFIKRLFKKAYKYEFRFESFLGALKFYQGYALKNFKGDRYLERFEDRVSMVALYLAQGDENIAESYLEEMMTGRFQPATPTFLNCGKKQRGELVSCFPAGTKVDTDIGQVSIEELKVGDKVLTEDGKFNNVIALNERKFNGKLLKLKIVGTPEITVTPEHPFLVRKQDFDCREEVHEYADAAFKWIAAKDIKPLRDQVVMAAPLEIRPAKTFDLFKYVANMVEKTNGRKPSGYVKDDGFIKYQNQDKRRFKKENYSKSFVDVKSEVSESEEFGRFVGYYLAEGYTSLKHPDKRPKAVIFTFGSKEKYFIEDVVNLSESLFGITPTININNNDNSAKISINNVFVAELMMEICGTGFGKKYLTSDIESAPFEYIKGILIGACRGDGCCTSNGVMLDFVNPALIHQLKLLATRIGLTPDARYYSNQKGNLTGTLRFSGSTSTNEDFIFSVGKNLQNYNGASPYGIHKGNNYSNFHDIVSGKCLALVQSLTESAEDFGDSVYNIQVENNPTYSVNGVVVHNCFLVRIEDNMESIGKAINASLQLSKRGGGVALLLSNLRETGAPIKKIENQSSGVVPIMKMLEDAFSYANQLGARQGAGAVYLNVHHPDILTFLDTKRENADEKIRIKTLSLGVVIPDVTFKLAKEGREMALFSPYDVQRIYGKAFGDISVTEMYDELLADDRIKKSYIDPREIFRRIAEIQFESGYPYIMYEDTVNRANPIKGRINMSNLCSEILQVNTPAVLDEDSTYAEMGKDISCNLGSQNIAKAMESPDFGASVERAIRALTAVSDMSNIASVPTIEYGNRKSHAIGLGQMNLHGYLASQKIHYGSDESLDFTNMYFYTVVYHALRTSNLIAIERKEVFDGFEDSKYASGEYFDKYVTQVWEPRTDKVRGLFEKAGIAIPTQEDWKELKRSVMEFGIYNQNLQAIPPTGSISYINNSTASIHPVARGIEIRKEGKTGRVYFPAPYMTNENREYYTSAYDVGYKGVIDVYAEATQHVDQGLSLTLFMYADVDTRELNKAQIYAFKKGIKTLYYVRLQQAALEGTEVKEAQSIAECESCAL